MCRLLGGGGLGGIADTGDPDFDPAIRGQAVDEGSPGLDGITLGAGDRVALAIALDAHLVCGQPLANQEVGDRVRDENKGQRATELRQRHISELLPSIGAVNANRSQPS